MPVNPDAPIPNTPETARTSGATAAEPLPRLDGATTIDAGMTFEVELAAYESVGVAAERIKRRIAPELTAEKHTIVFIESPPGVYLEARDIFVEQTQNLIAGFGSAGAVATEALAELTKPPVVRTESVAGEAVIPGPTRILATATSILGLLRSDVSYSGRKVEIDPLALTLELARQWEDDSTVDFVDFRFFPPHSFSWTSPRITSRSALTSPFRYTRAFSRLPRTHS